MMGMKPHVLRSEWLALSVGHPPSRSLCMQLLFIVRKKNEKIKTVGWLYVCVRVGGCWVMIHVYIIFVTLIIIIFGRVTYI